MYKKYIIISYVIIEIFAFFIIQKTIENKTFFNNVSNSLYLLLTKNKEIRDSEIKIFCLKNNYIVINDNKQDITKKGISFCYNDLTRITNEQNYYFAVFSTLLTIIITILFS